MIAFIVSLCLYLFLLLGALLGGNGATFAFTALLIFAFWWLPLPFAMWGLCHKKQLGWNIAAILLTLPWIWGFICGAFG